MSIVVSYVGFATYTPKISAIFWMPTWVVEYEPQYCTCSLIRYINVDIKPHNRKTHAHIYIIIQNATMMRVDRTLSHVPSILSYIDTTKI
jgi:hypothetical protein